MMLLQSITGWLERGVTRLLFLLLSLLLVMSFALWGVGDIFTSSNRDVVVAKVGSVEIRGDDFLRLYSVQTEKVREALGREMDYDMGKTLGFVDTVMSDLVERALFDQASLDLGLAASDRAARQAIFSAPEFHDERGLFSEIKFRQVLNENFYTEESFVEGLRQDIRRRQLTHAIAGFLDIPETILHSVVALRAQARRGRSMLLPLESVPLPKVPSLDEQKAWYEEHKEQFVAPPYRHVRLLSLDVRDMEEDMAIDEARLRALYKERRGYAYTKPEKRDIYQILSDDEETLRRAITLIRGGQDFLETAATLFDMEEKDAELGWNTKQEVIADLADDVFSLEKGEVSDALKSPFGWHAILVNNIEEEVVRPYEEVRDLIRQEILLDEGMDAVFDLYGQIEDAFAGGGTLEDASHVVNIPLQDIPAIDEQGHHPQGEAVDVPLTENDRVRFLRLAFDLPLDETSHVVETETGLFVLRVDGEEPERQREFAEAQQDVIASIQHARRKDILTARANAIVTAVNKGERLETFAQRYKSNIVPLKPFTRSNFVEEEVPGEMVEKLFNAEEGDAVFADVKGDAYMIAVLEEIIEADVDNREKADPIVESLAGALRRDLMTQYARYLRSIYSVSIFERAIEELL
ncbi:MAG: SurA N-terminal domain-containing protein [Alphaproteobacteria bacterium GM7ARS4]|nr:SurA N-terminal domain-containing protein [Alphaproteobacteria bacterium GM7ARS4]